VPEHLVEGHTSPFALAGLGSGEVLIAFTFRINEQRPLSFKVANPSKEFLVPVRTARQGKWGYGRVEMRRDTLLEAELVLSIYLRWLARYGQGDFPPQR